jgi:hypothetical protein
MDVPASREQMAIRQSSQAPLDEGKRIFWQIGMQ